MLLDNYTSRTIQLEIKGAPLVLLPGRRNISEENLPPELVDELVLNQIEGIRVVSEYPSIVLKEL
tara:strand:- start:5 stop:199 length:195 start_codon:yes stop_codon:yes gene_type:complete